MSTSRAVTIVKTLSWRIWGTLISYIVAFWVTGDLTISLSVGTLEAIVKTFIYYFHERIWQLPTMESFAKRVDRLTQKQSR